MCKAFANVFIYSLLRFSRPDARQIFYKTFVISIHFTDLSSNFFRIWLTRRLAMRPRSGVSHTHYVQLEKFKHKVGLRLWPPIAQKCAGRNQASMILNQHQKEALNCVRKTFISCFPGFSRK